MSLIECTNAALAYDGRTVVENLNFTVNTGDYLCIVGENGSGKSTLVSGILGFKKPVSGMIALGEGLTKEQIGYLPQMTSAQRDFPASVYEVVLSGCMSKKGFLPFYNKADKALAKKNMEKLSIWDLAKRCYRELSGGQQQRVLLARALCATKKLLLLDEPVAGLDPIVTGEMYALIEKLNQEDGLTIVMVSHDISGISKSASHILHLAHEPLFFGTRETYFQSDVGQYFLRGVVR